MNRLSDATSPYLLQHARNPVDWYQWGDEALERARAEDKPLLVSIGYAACHWCHVMERESFEDPAIAAIMNERFVCIKVDREERPDLDSIYMTAVQAMTGHGGWPMTVFCAPDGSPFFGGTYYPPEPRHGLPSFRQILDAVWDAWTTKRDGVLQQGAEVTEYVRRSASLGSSAEILSPDTLTTAARAMLRGLDGEWGGFGGAPKFPQPMTLDFLLRMHLHGNPDALDAVTLTLDKMARGGIFDQVGGGFHRYAVDRVWLVPHFEKMLYDNAQLLRLYARAWQVVASPLYRDTAIATGEYLLREMQQPDGGFSSSQDADSEGVEGKFYVWPYEELIAVTGDDMPLAVAMFAASGDGNFEGTNVLWRPMEDAEVARHAGISVDDLRAAVGRARAALFAAREQRVRPATDDKVIASWNGLAIAALAEAGRVLGRADFVDAASRAAGFAARALFDGDGRLLRSWRDGRTSGRAFLDDHAMLADGFLTLYETTFEPRWFERAMSLARSMLDRFAGPEGFYDTAADASALVVRPKDVFDNAVPSGNSAASDVLLRLAALTGDQDLEHAAAVHLRALQPAFAQQPSGFGAALCALDRYLGRAQEVAIVGDPAAPDARALLEAAWSAYLPNRVMAAGSPGSTEPALLRDRPALAGKATGYVCERFVCRQPVTDPGALERVLAGNI